MTSHATTVSDQWPLEEAALGRDVVLGWVDNQSRTTRDVEGADIEHTFLLSERVPAPSDALVRDGRKIVDLVMSTYADDLQQRFLREVAYAAAEAVAQNDLWLIAGVLQGWEADAEISQDRELAASVNEALSDYRAGDKGRPWEEVAGELGLDGGSDM